jgi:chemotaxis response regulator CheB
MQLLIVDSSSHIIQRLEEMLADAPAINTVYTSVSYENAIKLFVENKPDIVLLCACLPENKSLKLFNKIKSSIYKSAVVMLFVNTDEYIYNQYRLLGADCLLDKYRDFEQIPGVINSMVVYK